MHLFYTPDIILHSTLSEEESRHAVKVLRLKNGDEILHTDGKGNFYRSAIVNAHPKQCQFEILEVLPQPQERDFYIHIALAPTKNMERTEWFAEKATEIGIDEITPLLCRNSERKTLKNDRLERILLSAMKQSQKAHLPVVRKITSFTDFIKQDFTGLKLIAHCYDDAEKRLLKNVYKSATNALILIGPEGDFSKEEVEMAKKNGFIPISLGTSRLRTETAALAACIMLHALQ